MGNLIERLRESQNAPMPVVVDAELCWKAADEIEYLRAYLLAAKKDQETMTEIVKDLRAEIERLQNLYDIAVADRVRMHTEIERLQAALEDSDE